MSDQQPTPPPKQEAKAAPARKPRAESPVYKFFEVKGNQVNRTRKECPRCGRGVYLGEHTDRLTCGKCGYTSFRKPK